MGTSKLILGSGHWNAMLIPLRYHNTTSLWNSFKLLAKTLIYWKILFSFFSICENFAKPLDTVSDSWIWKDSDICISTKGGLVLPVQSPHFEDTSKMSHYVTIGTVYFFHCWWAFALSSSDPIKNNSVNTTHMSFGSPCMLHFCWGLGSYRVCTCRDFFSFLQNPSSMFSPVVEHILITMNNEHLSFHTVFKAVKFLYFSHSDDCVWFSLWP